MKIFQTKKKNKVLLNFTDTEWDIADKVHFGKTTDWGEKNFYVYVKEGDEVLGCIHLIIKAQIMEILTLIVSSKHRKMGIGTLLINKAEEIAKREKLHKIFLITGKEWDERAFYKKTGFKKAAELKNHYLKKDWIFLEKAI